MDKIFEREFENLRDLVNNSNRVMSKIAEEYERIIPMLVKAEDMSEEELVRRARQIKPLVRVDSELRKLDAGEDDENSKNRKLYIEEHSEEYFDYSLLED